VHDLSPQPINTLDRGKGISPAPEPGSSQPSPRESSRPRRGRGRARSNHRPATTATTDTVTNQPPTAAAPSGHGRPRRAHTDPAPPGRPRPGCCPRSPGYRVGAKPTDRPAHAGDQHPSGSSRNNCAATVVGAGDGRPISHLQSPVHQPAGQAQPGTRSGRPRRPGAPGSRSSTRRRHGRTDADPATVCPSRRLPGISTVRCVDGGDDGGLLAHCIRWSCHRVGLTGSGQWSVGAAGCRAGW